MSFVLDGSGISTITVSGSTSPTLSADKTRNQNIVFIGTLTANISAIFPPERRLWYVTNMSIGGYSITVKTLGGVGVVIPSNTSRLLTSDGIEIVPFEQEEIPVDSVAGLIELLESKADIISPVFQGTPTTPTAPEGSNTQQIANMEALTIAINAVKQELSTSQYIHIQSIAENPWIINHNLDKYPSVTVVDLTGVRVFGEEHYTSTDQVVIYFGSPFIGIAYLN